MTGYSSKVIHIPPLILGNISKGTRIELDEDPRGGFNSLGKIGKATVTYCIAYHIFLTCPHLNSDHDEFHV